MEGYVYNKLTQKKHIARFSLLHAELVCGNFSGYVLLPKIRVDTFSVFWTWQLAAPWGAFSPHGYLSPSSQRLYGRFG
jgi:hypothetical protein